VRDGEGDGARRALGSGEAGLVRGGGGELSSCGGGGGELGETGVSSTHPHDLEIIERKKRDMIRMRRTRGIRRRGSARGWLGSGDLAISDSGTDYYSVPRVIYRIPIYIYIYAY
jgi:hypothetical protein